MTRKIFLYLFVFFLLMGLNVFIIVRIRNSQDREASIQKILSEIDKASSVNQQFDFSNAPFNTQALSSTAKLADGREANLKAFFRKHGSPLYDFANQIVTVSDKYHFDYRLLAAIAMQESNLCNNIPADSYNCWGWGIYGNTVTRFPSYGDAIEAVSKGLKEQYLDKGLTTASMIMSKYNPSSPNGSWALGVNTFLRALE